MARHGGLRAISSTHLHVLFLLESEGLAERRLAERRLAERSRDIDDRRVVTISTASAGREAVEEINQIRQQTMSRCSAT